MAVYSIYTVKIFYRGTWDQCKEWISKQPIPSDYEIDVDIS